MDYIDEEYDSGLNVTKCTSRNYSGLRKVLVSMFYVFFAHVSNCFVIVVMNDRLPDREKHPPLPDLVLDNLPYIPWAGKAAEICLAIEVLIWAVMLPIHKQRVQIVYRTFLVAGTLYWMRCFCILVTSLPVPDTHKKCFPFPDSDMWDKLRRALDIYARFGLKVTGTQTCGDYIFSGHTTMLTMVNLFINEYAPRSRCFIRGVTWTLNVSGMLLILLCRGHYTIDVLLAFYLTYQVFIFYHHFLVKERPCSFPCKYFDFLSEYFEGSDHRIDTDFT